MTRICEDRVVVVTGAGRGIGRQYALEFARQGASVVVNDVGVHRDGSGEQWSGPAEEVAAEVRRLGGQAVVNLGDVADFASSQQLIDDAVTAFGRVDVLVNNAGILRDQTIVDMSTEDWDSVIRVHLRGTFGPTHWAAVHWRDRSEQYGPVDGRLINTTSSSGIFATRLHANYSAAKAGIAAFTIVASNELASYGVTANAIYPTALSRLTEDQFKAFGLSATDEFDEFDPANVAPLVVWLGSVRSSAVTGRVFGARGGRIVVANGWEAGARVDVGRRWEPGELDDVIADLLSSTPENADMTGVRPGGATARAPQD